MKRFVTLFSLLLLLLTACADPNAALKRPALESLTVTLGETQTTLDSAAATAAGSDTILYHLYENLLRWEDDGNGYAQLAPGQAESYTTETAPDGSVTYTFTLREDIRWSDGQRVTAQNFVTAWKRLANPANALPHRELLRCIAGYDAVQESGLTNQLAVSAPDSTTLVVTVNKAAPYFLETVCAGAYTMPVRTESIHGGTLLTNGAYTAAFTRERISLVKSETYYDAANVSVPRIEILPADNSQADYDALLHNETDFVENLPLSATQDEETSGISRDSDAVTATLAIALNTMQEPFTSAEVRTALRLAVDQQQLADILADSSLCAATGPVPHGVSDVGTHTVVSEETEGTEDALPDPNALPKEALPEPAVRWDFREHSKEIVTMDTSSDYDSDCDRARALLAQAGYSGGVGFPAVDYLYIDSTENALIARAIQAMWQEQLGITVTLRAVTQEEYTRMLTPVTGEDEDTTLAVAPFQIAAVELTADCNDALAFLAPWHSESSDNFTGYRSDAFDILLNSAALTDSADVYDAYLHDAEAILLNDAPLIPLCYRTRSFALSEGLTGLYHAPNGIYFFSRITNT